MRFDVLTLFPGIFPPYLAEGVIGRGVREGLVAVGIHDIRDEGEGRHRTVDDVPFGGGAGMVMKPGPIVRWIRRLRADGGPRGRIVLLSPQGPRLTTETAIRLASEDRLILICGRYEGIDDRVREHFIDEEISIGDYVLTGGELPALVVIDAVSRLTPGVVGNDESVRSDSLYDGLLKYPQFTQPRVFEGMGVPDVLLSGDHGRIAAWRREATLRRTATLRPDLLDRTKLTEAERAMVDASVPRTADGHRHAGGRA